jgi:hypothetical protein
MSLIVTHISKFGIIHATDGNLTASNGSTAGQAPKVFPIQFLNAGLTVAGSYCVTGQSMDMWMRTFIQGQERDQCGTLKAFATALAAALQNKMTQTEKRGGSIIHIAGYVQDKGRSHPEFWFVRNVYGMDQVTGEYRDFRDTFQISEDFWNRDWDKNNLDKLFQEDGYQIYINGFTSGRVSYMILQSIMNQFFQSVWSNPAWEFRAPKSLEDNALLVELYIRMIGMLFRISDYSAPFVGGTPQIYIISDPTLKQKKK